MRLSWSKSTATLRLLSMVLWSWYCLSAVNAHAQGVSISGQAIVNTPTSVSGIPGNTVLQAVPGAKITVCASTGGGIPCSPLVTIYSNITLTTVAPNPLTTDANGNFQFFVPVNANGYIYSETGPGIVGQLFVVATGAAGPPGPSGPPGPGGTLSNNSGFTAGGNAIIKGPIPWADLSFYARPQAGTTACSALATISLVTPTQVALNNSTCFQNGDGITITGAGPANGLITPTLSTVTPASISAMGMALGGGNTSFTTVQGVAGSSTYSYILVGRDKFGGYTPASAPVSTTTGLPSLGTLNCPITSMSRSGTAVTINFTAACGGAVVGAALWVQGTTGGAAFSVPVYNISTVNSSTQVIATGQYASTSFGYNAVDTSTPNSSTGGTAYFVASNHLQWAYNAGTWYYYVCARRPGDANYHLIGHTYPSTPRYEDIQFDDYGSPVNDSQLYPTYIETGSDTPNSNDAICTNGSGLADPLTTTVASGGGTSAITLTVGATTAVSNVTAKFDDGPGLVAAANTVKNAGGLAGELYIPASKFFIINSYTLLPSSLKIRMAGAIKANETVEMPAGVQWDASAGVCSPGNQFSYYSTGGGCFYIGAAYPVTFISGDQGDVLRNMTFLTENNYNGQLVTLVDGQHATWDNVNYTLSQSTNTDYLATAVVLRGNTSSSETSYEFQHMNFMGDTLTSPTGVASWVPFGYMPAAQDGSGNCFIGDGNVSFDKVGMYGRGFLTTTCASGGSNWSFKNTVRQAGFAPLMWVASKDRITSGVDFNNVTLDTSAGGYFTSTNQTGNCAQINVSIVSYLLQGGGQFGGCGPTTYRDSFNGATGTVPNFSGKSQGCNLGTLLGTAILTENCNYDYEGFIGPNAKIFFPLAAPTSPTVSAISGGVIAANVQVEYEIVANDLAGQSSIGSAASGSATTSGTCPGSGNCQFSVGWTGSLGASTYSVFGCQVGASNYMVQCPTFGSIPNATNITANPITINSLGGLQNFQPPAFALAGRAALTSTYAWSMYLKSNPQVFANLIACSASSIGITATVTDSTTITWGATITGGGANTVLAFCDGTNWTVYGK